MKITFDKAREYVSASTEVELHDPERPIAEHLLKHNSGEVSNYDIDNSGFDSRVKSYAQGVIVEISKFDEMKTPELDYEKAEKLLNSAIKEFRKQIAFIQDVKIAMSVIDKL